MSKLAGISEGKKYIVNGVELTLKSLPIDGDVAKILEQGKNVSETDSRALLIKLIKKTLKEAVPDATEEELNDCMRLGNYAKLVNIFYELNGLLDKENISNTQKIKDAIQQRQALANKEQNNS